MTFTPGSLVRARGREWVVLPDSSDNLLVVRPLGGPDEEVTGILRSLEPVESASVAPPDPERDLGIASRAGSFDADPWLTTTSLGVVTALSTERRIGRYQRLTEASAGTCPPDDVWHEQQPRVGVEPFDAAGRPLWDAGSSYIAALRLAGSPVVDREPFEPADITAFANVTGSWSVVDDALTADAAAAETFGDPTWDLLKLEIRSSIGADGEFGAAVLVDSARRAQGVPAIVRRFRGRDVAARSSWSRRRERRSARSRSTTSAS